MGRIVEERDQVKIIDLKKIKIKILKIQKKLTLIDLI